MNTQKTSPIDHIPVEKKTDRRWYYLTIELILYSIWFLSIVFTVFGASLIAAKILLAGAGIIVLFNFIIPIIKVVRKEIKLWLFPFCLLQGLMINLFIIGVFFKVESWPYASEFLIVSLLSIGFTSILVSNLEIIKYKADAIAHLLVTCIGIALTLGCTGFLFRVEAFPKADVISQAGLAVAAFCLLAVLIQQRNPKNRFLTYYIPRLILLLILLSPSMF